MIDQSFHYLLDRQIKKNLNENLLQHPEIQKFLKVVNQAYFDFDEDGQLQDNIININQRELDELNSKLREANDLQKNIIEEKTLNLRKALNIVRQKEEKYRKILENLTELIVMVNSEGIVSYVSPNVNELMGYTEEEILGQKMDQIVSPEQLKEYRSLLKEAEKNIDKKSSASSNIKLRTKNKNWVEYELVLNINTDENDSLNVLITLRDLTQLRKYQLELEKQKQFYENILRKIPVDIAIFDKDHRYLYVNQIALSDPNNRNFIIGKDDFEYMSFRGLPVESAVKRRQLFLQAKNTKNQVSFEDSVPMPNQNERTILRHFFPVFDDKNELELMIGYGVDITFRRQNELKVIKNEEKLNKIMNSALDAIIIIDAQGLVTFVNPSAERVFGWSSSEMLHKQLTETIIPNYHSAAHQKGMHDYQKGKDGPVLNKIIEVPARKKDGQETIIELTIIPIEIDGNTFFCSFIRDVSQRKKAEQEIKDLNLHLEDKVMQRTFQLETAIKELDSFSYSVSHDLRSPLRAIDGWSLALIEDFTDVLNEEALNYINRIRNESQRMGGLIDDILNLSRIGRTELIKTQVSLYNLTNEIFERLIQGNPRKNVIKFNVEENLSLFVDEKMFSILFTNLIENSIKFTSKVEAPEIYVGSGEKNDRKVIFIRDNGAGFNMENASKLFGAFQRMHRASEFPGTGIGLATVQRIVRLHGGEIWAESEINKGTTFYIYIPQSPEK